MVAVGFMLVVGLGLSLSLLEMGVPVCVLSALVLGRRCAGLGAFIYNLSSPRLFDQEAFLNSSVVVLATHANTPVAESSMQPHHLCADEIEDRPAMCLGW